MTTIQLTETQHAVLAHAIAHAKGCIDWFPEGVKGGARKRVLDALTKRGLVDATDTGWCVLEEGYRALGWQRTAPEATCALPCLRAGTKQATVLAMLQRSEGATIAQIMEATGWQAHTVRGAFAGVIRKRLVLDLFSEKHEGIGRVYKIR